MDEEIAVVAELAQRAGLALARGEGCVAAPRRSVAAGRSACRRRRGLAHRWSAIFCVLRPNFCTTCSKDAPPAAASSMSFAVLAIASPAASRWISLGQRVLHRIEALRRRRLDVGDHQDVPAEAGLHRIAGLALGQREGDAAKLLRQIVFLHPAEIGRGSIGIGQRLRDGREILAAIELRLRVLGGRFIGQQHLLRYCAVSGV